MSAQARAKQLRWDTYFLNLAHETSLMSRDPSTCVGAVIVGPKLELRCSGFNGFPRNIKDDERLHDRETKLQLIVHAEMNAILAAARIGIPLEGCTMYISATNKKGDIWGGPPCVRCAVEALQAGIRTFVSHETAHVPSRWASDLELSRKILIEAGVTYREVG